MSQITISILNKCLKVIEEEFDDVSCGGCACVAAMVARKLRHEFPVMRILVTSGRFNDNKAVNLDEIRSNNSGVLSKWDWKSNGVGFNHVWLEIWRKGRWYVLDASGVSKRGKFYAEWGAPHIGSFSIDEVELMAADSNGWNSWFDRRNLPQIELMIEAIPV